MPEDGPGGDQPAAGRTIGVHRLYALGRDPTELTTL